MAKKKSVEMRALELAIYRGFHYFNPDCETICDGKECDSKKCDKRGLAYYKAHFLSLAKKEMDKEKI